MEKALTTIMLTIASVVALMVVVNAVVPTVYRAGSSMVVSSATLDDRLKSNVEIIHASGQVASTDAYVWLKNVGSSTLPAIDRTDIFFGTSTSLTRIPYGTAGCTSPCWEYVIENGPEWEPTTTVRIVIHLTAALVSGETYYVKAVLYNGITDSRYFTL